MKHMVVNQRPVPQALLMASAAVLLVSGCASGPEAGADGRAENRQQAAAAPSPAAVRTDLEPLKRRFPKLGPLSESKWVSRMLTLNSVPEVPGPTDVSLDGVAHVEPGTLAGITASGVWAESAIECGVPKELAAEVGGTTGWLNSQAFDRSVTLTRYSGSFYFDPRSSRVYFCTVNPEVRSD
ncbi:hypothetical protein [Streptomyces sp. CBMA156]|uniref:hypothetical protein n=1 Tax=Streptomyces sp. CBMA156 TaxID=1930280 RepID=UPI00166204B8|nr:hypothetical protein [Streptomyces sp. CBMA156]MBD0674356.1 hypothetical protein [Streptomyces sp. CBMA156]